MIDQTLRHTKQEMEQVLLALSDQLKTLHIGRASSAMVENLLVEYYGSTLPLKQVGSITIPEANQIIITPWDKGALGPIEASIRASDLGINPVNDGQAIRIVLPLLTEDRRLELVKVVGKMAEEARIALRNQRHTAWEAVQSAQKSGNLTEDDRERGRKELDKLIEGMNGSVEKITKEKEQALLAL
ncbi:MAG: ribosome recycling factor [Patescibacteria group bacterium]